MKQTKVELFSFDRIEVMEDTVNAWFANNQAASILDIKFHAGVAPGVLEHDHEVGVIYTACVLYELEQV